MILYIRCELAELMYRYKAYCYREEVMMRKAFYVLNQYSEQRQIERNKLFKIQNSVAFDLVKNTFYMWVKKYQYRITRRPMLLKALNFWAENTLSKSMRSWKVYKATMTEERKKYRTFWVIRGAV